MISKETFVKTLNDLERSYIWDLKLCELFTDGCCYCNPLADTVIKLLNESMGIDTSKFDTISWWVYELECGRDYEEGIMSVDGKPIDISEPEKFYDYLIEYEVKNE